MGVISSGKDGTGQNYPHILVITEDYTNGKIAPSKITAGEIEKIFTENGFPVIEQGQISPADIKALSPIFTTFPGKVVKLGKKYGADAVITGRATGNIVKTDVPYGTAVYTYQVRIETRIVKTDTGDVVSMDKSTYVAREKEKSFVQKKAFSGAAHNISKSLIQKVSAIWQKEVYKETMIELVCENTTADKAELLKKAFKFTRGVVTVEEGSFKEGTLELKIRFLGTSERLARLLRQFVQPVFDVTMSGPEKINIGFVEKNKDFTGKTPTGGTIQTQ